MVQLLCFRGRSFLGAPRWDVVCPVVNLWEMWSDLMYVSISVWGVQVLCISEVQLGFHPGYAMKTTAGAYRKQTMVTSM